MNHMLVRKALLWSVVALTILAATACRSKFEGTYSNANGSIMLEVKSGGKASLTIMGETAECTYTVGGNQLLDEQPGVVLDLALELPQRSLCTLALDQLDGLARCRRRRHAERAHQCGDHVLEAIGLRDQRARAHARRERAVGGLDVGG